MLWHACGYELQKQNLPTRVIQAWLGHADIRHTELSSIPFKAVWRDKDRRQRARPDDACTPAWTAANQRPY
jgi:hypothetical protein